MSNDSSVTLVGNCSRDPEIRYTPSGATVVTLGLVFNKRIKNRYTQQYEDGPAQFFDVKCWGSLAENVAETIQKGNRIIVFGELEFRSWETDAGEKRSKVEVNAQAVGPDLRWATAQVVKISRSDQTQGGGYQQQAPAAASDNPY